jgi:hypothetical protein
VTNNLTLNVPTNGVFNFTTVTVADGIVLRFNRNPLNTPVYLLATGDVVIDGYVSVTGTNASGSIAGTGGPGGFDGGFGAFQGFPDGEGQGPGGGASLVRDANAVFGSPSPGNTNIYGNTLLSPLIGGSGGSGRGGSGGGGGGGAILIASSTKISLHDTGINGGVYARGGDGAVGVGGGGGSGGGIRIVAPVVDGDGWLETSGGVGVGRAGSGRSRIDTTDRFAWRGLHLANNGKWTVGSQMFVFPPGNPHLDIITAAGTAIPEGTNSPVTVTLPVGSSTNQIVRVQGRGFTNDTAIRVKITPENAPSATFDSVIQQSSGNPPFADVQVTLPLDTVCHVHAWTR